jgi:16S rRNA (guanine966-N2)-methyltransferase
MRIIGGARRGLKLAEVGAGDPGAQLRPTSDRVREAVFNLLGNGARGNLVAGARVLDLFAGTGALGLEALSRGAAEAWFVEDGRAARALVEANIARMGAQGATRILARDATRLPACPVAPFDLIFLDPPYGRALGEAALATAHAGGWLAPGATILWEEGAPPLPPPGFEVTDQRRYGDTLVTLLKAP